MFIDLHPVIKWIESYDYETALALAIISMMAGCALVALFSTMLITKNKKEGGHPLNGDTFKPYNKNESNRKFN